MVTLTFDARVAWPAYDWMGPAKAALEAIVRYLARELGPRDPRQRHLRRANRDDRSALDPGIRDPEIVLGTALPAWVDSDDGPVADATAFLLSDLSRGITGEMIHVDGGYHSQGAPSIEPAEAKV